MLWFGWSPIYKSSRHFINLLVTVPITPITKLSCSIYFSVPLQGLGTYLSFHFLSVLHWAQPGQQSPLFGCSTFLLLTITRSGHLDEIRWSVYISKSQRRLCISFSRVDSGLCIYHLFVWSNLNFLHNSQWITFPTQSCLVFYSFCINWLHSLIMWLIVSSLSPHNLYLVFCCTLSIFAFTQFLLHCSMLILEDIEFLF